MSITSLTLIIIQMRQDNEQVIFNGDFERKIFAGTGFEPSTFRPTSSGLPFITVPSGIFCLAQLAPTWLPLASGGPSPMSGHQQQTSDSSQKYPECVRPREWVCNCFTYSSVLPGPPTIVCFQFVPYHPISEERKSFGKSWD